MTPTDKVLGKISAMNTFIENFPMSILDMMHGKVYTSIFDFVIDVLAACGVDINEIIQFLLEEIYAIEAQLNNGLEDFYENLKNGAVDINAQNEFLEKLEYAIKGIFMALLSSIFTCSAIPVLPNKVFDAPNSNSFNGSTSKAITPLLNNAFPPFLIPKGLIDPMGILDINPTSKDGRLFYATEGRDRYYRREYVPVTIIEKVKEVVQKDEEKTVSKFIDEHLYEKQVKLYFVTNLKGNKTSEDVNKINISEPVNSDITVMISYSPYGTNAKYTWESKILKGERESMDKFLCSPVDMFGKGQRSIIHSISINNNGGGVDIGDKTWVYLCKESSSDFISRWPQNGMDSLRWSGENNATHKVEKKETQKVTKDEEIEVERERIIYEFRYVECTIDDLTASNVNIDNVERVNYVPDTDVKYTSPEYIVHYDGLNANNLYKTMDMNAFLWYVLHKGMKIPQVEYNHMMWDSRISARKIGVGFKSSEEWNQWYNSKKTNADEFTYFGQKVTDTTPIFPIIQLESQGMAENLFRVHIPSQRYFLPKVRNANIFGTEKPKHAFNASMYKFNWDYLNNIQILQPKLLIVGLCEYLLGFSLSTISSTNINFTKKLIESKLSSAIKSVIESNDMEVENCYMEFSNDEINTMMEEMLLSRYNASSYGGETSTVRIHDTQKYVAMLDQVNANASSEGNITNIKKIVTEVTVDPGTEGSIDYGLKISSDGNLLKKLLWAIVMPILMSIFTPQIFLLLYLNFDLMGITNMKDFMGQDFTKILNLIMNKIFGLLKSIILFIKDKIVELLLTLLYEKLIKKIIQMEMLILLEKITSWLAILEAAINCLPIFKFKRNKIIGAIEDVNYADIITSQNTPETNLIC